MHPWTWVPLHLEQHMRHQVPSMNLTALFLILVIHEQANDSFQEQEELTLPVGIECVQLRILKGLTRCRHAIL
jgi:hypothetical protein